MAGELSASVIPQMWLGIALDIQEKNLVMAPLVWQDPFNAAIAAYGDTINTRKPTKRTVRDWGGQADTGDLANKELVIERPLATNVAIILNKLKYAGWMEEDRDTTLSIQNLRDLLVAPAVVPLSEAIDLSILQELLTGTDGDGAAIGETALSGPVSGVLIEDDIVNLMTEQDIDEAPPGRNLVMSVQHRGEALKNDLFVQVQQAGSDSALRRAFLGPLFDYQTYWTQNMPENTSGPQSVGFHQTAIAYATRRLAPVPPGLGTVSASMAYKGYSLRLQVSHNHRGMGADVSIDALWGVKLMDAKKARKLVG